MGDLQSRHSLSTTIQAAGQILVFCLFMSTGPVHAMKPLTEKAPAGSATPLAAIASTAVPAQTTAPQTSAAALNALSGPSGQPSTPTTQKTILHALFESLSEAIREDKTETLAQLLAENPTLPINAPDPSLTCAELTLLDVAVYHKKQICARVLLDKKAKPTQALENAIYWAKPTMIGILLEYGAKPTEPCIKLSRYPQPLTPLAYAKLLASGKYPRLVRCTNDLLQEIITLLKAAAQQDTPTEQQ